MRVFLCSFLLQGGNDKDLKMIENSGGERRGKGDDKRDGEERREEKGNKMRKGEIGLEKERKLEEKKR